MFYRVFELLKNSFLTKSVYANGSLQDQFGDVQDGDHQTVASFITSIYEFALPLAVTVSIILLIYGGFKLITSAGDPDKLNEAKEIITNAIMGVIMIGIGMTILAIIAGELVIPLD